MCSQLTPPVLPDDELLDELELEDDELEEELDDELELLDELDELLDEELVLPEPQLIGPPLPDWDEHVLRPIQLALFSQPQPLD